MISAGVRVGGYKRINCFKCIPYDGINAEPQPVSYAAHVERKKQNVPVERKKQNVENKPIQVHTCQSCGDVLERKRILCKTCRSYTKRYKYRYFCMSYKGWKCECCFKESNRFDDFSEFDFHHTKDKLFEINQGDSMNMKAIKEELDKCELLCANCHRKKHSRKIPEWFRDNIKGMQYKGEFL